MLARADLARRQVRASVILASGLKMKIVIAPPPNFEQVCAAFPLARTSAIFAWDDTIYNPNEIVVESVLKVHEAVHGQRQKGKPELWWERYIADPEFRYAEELPAHRAEYRYMVQFASRNGWHRAELLNHTAKRLVAPLYAYGAAYTVQRAAMELLR